MKIEQVHTQNSNHTAYYLESNGEAAIFDPFDEVMLFTNLAGSNLARIRYVFETGFQGDCEKLHMSIKNLTGADIILGCGDTGVYYGIAAHDNQIFRVGDCKVKAIYTPGSTMEATSYLIIDEEGNEHGIITGGTLLIGDVGLPGESIAPAKSPAREKFVRILYNSLREKILPLSDLLIVYPNPRNPGAHRKVMSFFMTDTLGHQKKVNYALQSMSENQFVKAVLEKVA